MDSCKDLLNIQTRTITIFQQYCCEPVYDRQIDRQTDRQIDRRTDRQRDTDRQTERHR